MDLPTLGYYRTHDNVISPKMSTAGAACYDLSAHLIVENDKKQLTDYREVTIFTPENEMYTETAVCKVHPTEAGRFTPFRVVIPPRHRAIVPTGIIFDIPEGHSVRLHPRSGLSIKKGFIVANCEGVIDEDYFHEIKSLMVNNSDVPIIVEHGDRIVQAEIVKTVKHYIVETDVEPCQKTDRVGGLGSTGVKL